MASEVQINPYEIGLNNLQIFEDKQKAANNLSSKMIRYISVKREDLKEKSKKFKISLKNDKKKEKDS